MAFLSGLFGNTYVKLILAVLIAVAIATGVWYYNSSQSRISTLTEQVGKLQLVVDVQTETITSLTNSFNKSQESNTALAKEMAKIYTESQELKKLFSKHDLEKLASARPTLIQRRMNDAISKVLKDFETATKVED